MDDSTAVGRVLGTVDATPLQFWVAVRPGAYLQLDDVVVTTRELPGDEPVTISGVVTQVRARHEGAAFDSDVFAIADGTLPAQVQEAAEITTTRVEPELYVPPSPGAVVHRASGDERDSALYFDRMPRRVPIGVGRDGEPLYLNADFLDGTRGAHVSISGISGVATKTSFATWLLYSVFRSGVLGGRRDGQHQGAHLQRQGRGSAVPRPPQHPPRREDPLRLRPARADRAAVPRRVRLRAAAGRRPHRRPRRDQPADRGGRVLLDARRVLRRAAAALRVRRRRRRAPAVHDGGPRGHRPPGPQRRPGRRRSGHRRDPAGLVRRPGRSRSSSVCPTRTPAASGPARPSASGRSTPSCAG